MAPSIRRIAPKHSRDIGHLQSKILYLYASGNTVRTIQDQLKEMYGTEVSADFISRVTDGVLDDFATRGRRLMVLAHASKLLRAEIAGGEIPSPVLRCLRWSLLLRVVVALHTANFRRGDAPF